MNNGMLAWSVACATVMSVASVEAAIYWKDNAYSRGGWMDGPQDHFLDLYTNWDGTGGWTEENAEANFRAAELLFENAWPLWSTYTCCLSNDLTVSHISINAGHNNIRATWDFAPHALRTSNQGWGLFLKGEDNVIDLVSGELEVAAKVSIGSDNGNNNTLRVSEGAVLKAPSALGVGGGSGEGVTSTNNVLDVDGGLVLFESGWGFAVGEGSHEAANKMLVHNGGIVSNLQESAVIGLKSCRNTLEVTGGGLFYNHNFLQLGKGEWSGLASKNNMIKVDNGGRIKLHHSLYISDGTSEDVVDNGNVVWVGSDGLLDIDSGDIVVQSGGNHVVVSNGVLTCNSFHTIAEDKSTASNTSVAFAGVAPELIVRYYFSVRQNSTLHFQLPDVGFATTPLTVRNGCKFLEDANLTVDVSAWLRNPANPKEGRFRLINADSDGWHYQKVYVPDDDEASTKLNALLARWNAALPKGARLYLSEGHGEGGAPGLERCELWLEVHKPGFAIFIR